MGYRDPAPYPVHPVDPVSRIPHSIPATLLTALGGGWDAMNGLARRDLAGGGDLVLRDVSGWGRYSPGEDDASGVGRRFRLIGP